MYSEIDPRFQAETSLVFYFKPLKQHLAEYLETPRVKAHLEKLDAERARARKEAAKLAVQRVAAVELAATRARESERIRAREVEERNIQELKEKIARLDGMIARMYAEYPPDSAYVPAGIRSEMRCIRNLRAKRCVFLAQAESRLLDLK